MKIFFKKLMLLVLFVTTSFSIYSQVSITDSLPVRLSYLNGERTGGNNRIDWKVACFLQYANFEIQRSSDNINFTSIHSFQADELRCLDPFFYIDNNAAEKSFYRVRVGDIDGRFYSSGIIALYRSPGKMDITAITPSINNGLFAMQLSSAGIDKANVVITGSAGNIVHQQTIQIQKGNNSVYFDLNHLTNGVYHITILNSTRETSKISFIKL